MTYEDALNGGHFHNRGQILEQDNRSYKGDDYGSFAGVCGFALQIIQPETQERNRDWIMIKRYKKGFPQWLWITMLILC